MEDVKNGNMFSSIPKKYRVVVSVVLILFTSLFLFWKSEKGYQVDSETLVVDPMLIELNGIKAELGVFGLGFLDNDEDYPYPFYTDFLESGSDKLENYHLYNQYTSQIGLQGYVFRGIAHVIRTPAIIGVLRFLCSLAFVTVLFFIAVNLKRLYGYSFATAFWIIVCLSFDLSNLAPNLYWFIFIWFVPMLLGTLVLAYPEKRKWIYHLFFLAILIKSLCGYEYISTIMLSGIVFQIVDWISRKESGINGFKCVLFSGLSMLAGFVAAVFMHVFVLSMEFCKGDFSQGFQFFFKKIVSKRTFGNASDFEERIGYSLKASVWDVLRKYFWESDYGKVMSAIIISAVIIVIIDRLVFKKDCRIKLMLIALHLISVLSWLILAKSHSFDHMHISYVLFDMGLTQTCLYCILKTFSDHFYLKIKGKLVIK